MSIIITYKLWRKILIHNSQKSQRAEQLWIYSVNLCKYLTNQRKPDSAGVIKQTENMETRHIELVLFVFLSFLKNIIEIE